MNALRERAQVDLESLSAEDASSRLDGFLPFVKKLSADDDGLSVLAKICAAYSLERPAPAANRTETDDSSEPAPESSSKAGEFADEARADEAPADAVRRRRRSGRSGSGGSRSKGDGPRDSNRGPRRARRGGSDSRRT